MQKLVWFAHGKKVPGIYCPWCDMRRTARIIRDLYLWRAVLSCGHVRSNMGLTLPYEELERKGYINYETSEDPRFTARKKHLFLEQMAIRDEAVRRNKAKEQFASGRLVH